MTEPRTLCELFMGSAERLPRAAAYLIKFDGKYHPVSSARVVERVRAVACGLVRLGVGPGDRVAILSENRLEWVIADYATLLCGAIVVPVYATLQPAQVQTQLRDSGAVVAFCASAAQRAKLGPETAAPALRAIIVFDSNPVPAGTNPGAAMPIPGRTVGSFLDLEAEPRSAAEDEAFERRWRAVRPDDAASIIYTSGTSGEAKGVVLTHSNMCANVAAMLRRVDLNPSDTALSFLPLSHVLERSGGHFALWWVGITIAYAESVDAVAQNLLEVRPSLLVSVPRFYEKMNARMLAAVEQAPRWRRALFFWAHAVGRDRVQHQQTGKAIPLWLRLRCGIADLLVFKKLRARMGGRMRTMISGGAPLSASIAEFFCAAGLPILEGYWLTETSPVLCLNPRHGHKLGRVGPALDNVELRIADNGEILARGPCVMRGYYNNPTATAAALADGWFHTGDIGELDADGYLRITDRLKDLIVTAGGKKVAPQPIEARLKAFQYLAETLLVGDHRKYVSALVVPNFANLEAFARTHGLRFASRHELVVAPRILQVFTAFFQEVNQELAPFERIKRFRVLDREFAAAAGELTPSMKVKRAVVTKTFAALIEELYAEPAPPGVGCP
jgi:long-chain acyl-CoA synthetase